MISWVIRQLWWENKESRTVPHYYRNCHLNNTYGIQRSLNIKQSLISGIINPDNIHPPMPSHNSDIIFFAVTYGIVVHQVWFPDQQQEQHHMKASERCKLTGPIYWIRSWISSLCLNKPSRWYWCMLKLGTTDLRIHTHRCQEKAM